MTQKTGKEAIREAVERLLAEEDVIDNNAGYRYAKAALLAYDEIRMLLGRGIKFVKICKSFEVSGLLPENANAHSFREAFHRECRRRGEKYSRTVSKREKALGEKKTVANRTPHQVNQPTKSVPEKSDVDSAKEEARKMGAVTVETGSGKITKYSDGGFDF